MPSFERVFRNVDLLLAKTDEERAYLKGKHDGLDRGRKQAVVIFIIAIVLMQLFQVL